MDPRENKVRIGLISKPHGVKGSLKVLPLTPDPNRFEGLKAVWLEKNERVSPATIASVSLHKDHVLVSLEGLRTPEEADFWRNAYICIDKADRIPLPENAFFVDDLIGLEAYWRGNYFGRLVDVLQPGANDVYVFEREEKPPVYFPALSSTVEKIDLESGRIDILVPKGLLDEEEEA